MTRVLAACALLALAACQNPLLELLPNDPSPDAEICRREALNDPNVRRIRESNVYDNTSQQFIVRRELREALPRAYDNCMLRRGAVPAGGVERVRRTDW
ncbi:hypothetical protein GXW74_11455 [Roseomonas eburnea]|uniref:Uncharacterized protein n=1 Tax=Neoroseomonas eburnea TaxID=1346889 RepID=A0A9X9XBM0_9PROT|nr:hypothetical protein [Neoroseomonas eburnea]MBR0681106.1 hypothetical protein [Neoroseomonas eburnea]